MEGLAESKPCGIVAVQEKGEQREKKDGRILEEDRGGLTSNRQPSPRHSMNLLWRDDRSIGFLVGTALAN